MDTALRKDNFHKCLKEIERQYDRSQGTIAVLRRRLQEYSKDEEIQKLQEEVDYLRRHSLLIMNDKELAADRAFRDEHYKRHNPIPTKVGGNKYIYTLTGTGIGTDIVIECPICHESKNITDVDSW